MDGGALVVTVLTAVLDREVHVHVHAATTWTSWVLIVVILRQLHSTTESIAITTNTHFRKEIEIKQQRKRVMSHDYFEPRLGLHQARHYRLVTVRHAAQYRHHNQHTLPKRNKRVM
jgi:hypothetical protein